MLNRVVPAVALVLGMVLATGAQAIDLRIGWQQIVEPCGCRRPRVPTKRRRAPTSPGASSALAFAFEALLRLVERRLVRWSGHL